jgi:hypothetical protein
VRAEVVKLGKGCYYGFCDTVTGCVLYCAVLAGPSSSGVGFLKALQWILGLLQYGYGLLRVLDALTGLCLLDQAVTSAAQLAALSQLSSLAGEGVVD